MSTRQRVAVTGSSGLIGGALSSFLRDRGDEVVHLVRREPTASYERRIDPERGELEPGALDGVTAVVNLAGAGIGDQRWTDAYKRTLVSSRVDTTSTVARALASLDQPVQLVSGSAIGYYGDRGDNVLDETSGPGEGFLADLVQEWEAAAQPAVDAGCPTAYARTGLVFAADGGALERVLPLAKLGLAGPLGSGKQWWSWITLADEVRALAFLVDHPEITGPVNLVAPQPDRQRDVMKVLGGLLHRPAVLPAPSIALKVVLGELAEDVLGSQRVRPGMLEAADFGWEHSDVQSALRWVLAQQD